MSNAVKIKPSERIHDFKQDKVIGDEGEQIIKDYLNRLPSVHKVVDMANNKLFFHKDVDFVYQLINGEKVRAEIKTDQYKSGNIYYETVSNSKYETEGCMEKTECDKLFYFFINMDVLYIIDMIPYKNLMSKLIEEDHPAICKKSVSNQKNGYIAESIGYTLPLCVLEELMPDGSMKIVKEVKKKAGHNN